MAAIFDLLVTRRRKDFVNTDPAALMNSGNVGVAVGISLLSCIKAEIKVLPVQRPPSWIYHFRLLQSTQMGLGLTHKLTVLCVTSVLI